MKTRTTLTRCLFTVPSALLLLAATCQAHPGHAGHEVGGIGWGLVHPFTGLDHLLAALAVGMLAMLMRRASLPVVFLGAGLLGGLAGAKMGAFNGLELALAASAAAFGVAIVAHKHLANSIMPALVALGAAAHGWAHGSEAAGAMNLTGIFLGTAAIVAIGASVAFAARRTPRVVTGFGTAIAVAAFAILVGIL
jgi:urease accessory protein